MNAAQIMYKCSISTRVHVTERTSEDLVFLKKETHSPAPIQQYPMFVLNKNISHSDILTNRFENFENEHNGTNLISRKIFEILNWKN